MERKTERFSIYPLTHYTHSPPSTSPLDGPFVTPDEPTRTCRHHPEPTVYIRVPHDVVHSVGLGERVMPCVHHYGVRQYLLCPRNPLCSTCSSLPPSTVSIVLPFSKCHRVETIHYVGFSDRLLSRSKVHVRFLCVFSCPDSSFHSCAEWDSVVWVDHSLFIHHQLKGSLVASSLGSYK